MDPAVATLLLNRWVNFYVIVGSSAAGLTGLQFVVIALVSERAQTPTSGGIDAFSTPTVVYFSTVLLLSALVSAPWNGLLPLAWLVGLCGVAGILYTGLVTGRARRQTIYKMVLEDWLWHVTFPLMAQAMLLCGGLALLHYPGRAMFVLAAAALFLLFIGIHNAWDTATYLMLQRFESTQSKAGPGETPPA